MSKGKKIVSTKVSPPAKSPAPAKTAAPAPENGEAKVPKPKRAKVRLVSTSIPGLWVRAFVDVVDKYGYPLDPKGVAMVPGRAPVFGMTAEERTARKLAKEAEKARVEGMSDADKLAYAQAKREERQGKTLARKAAERDALIAQIKAEIAAGKL